MSTLTREEWLQKFAVNPELAQPFRDMIDTRAEDRGWAAEKFVSIKVWMLTEFEAQLESDEYELEDVFNIIDRWCQENCAGRYNKTIYASWYEFELGRDAEAFNARWNY